MLLILNKSLLFGLSLILYINWNSIYKIEILFYNKYSVEMKFEASELSKLSNISLLYCVSFDATKVRIENERKAS